MSGTTQQGGANTPAPQQQQQGQTSAPQQMGQTPKGPIYKDWASI